MPRIKRQLTDCGIYHVIVKGMGSQLLFEDDQDRKKFLSILQKYKEEMGFKINGYCLMDNHVHLLIWDRFNDLSNIMKRINLSYVTYFNRKYERSGSLFHGRFKSEIISSHHYLLAAFRYILRNPENAGICNINNYKWSSYSDYIRKNKKKLTDTSFMLNVIYDNYGSITFDDFIKKQSEFSIMEITQPHFRNDKSVINLIRKTLHLDSPQRIQSFSKELRNKCLKQLKTLGIPVRQLERIIGISRGIIQRI